MVVVHYYYYYGGGTFLYFTLCLLFLCLMILRAKRRQRQQQYNNAGGVPPTVTYQNENGHSQYVAQSSYQPGAYQAQPYVQPYGGQANYMPPPSAPAYVPAN